MDHEPSLCATTTDLIETAENNDATALNQLIPLVYDELRALAHRRLAGERRHDSLQTTALIHEVYLKLVDDTRVTQRGPAHFFAAVSRAMRQILVGRARRRTALFRGSACGADSRGAGSFDKDGKVRLRNGARMAVQRTAESLTTPPAAR